MFRIAMTLLLSITLAALTGLSINAAESYQPTWESLSKHSDPQWFQDAKFGIYTHWGPVTIGSENAERGGVQWYGMRMYDPKNAAFEYHRETFGDQKQVGYKDIAARFKGQKFDARQWAKLFAASGAKFAGPVVIHHDNYAMWDSALTEWDSQDQSPKRDFTGELAEAIRAQNMKFIATFHHSFSWRYFEPSYKFDGADAKYAGLYCESHKPGAPPTKNFLDLWLGKVNEVVSKYEPDLIWFDFGLGDVIPSDYQQRMFADYYNWADKRQRSVAVAHKHWDIHEHTGVIDFERGRLDYSPKFPWLTDTSVGPWFHQKSEAFKTVDELVDVLVDIVSKNGCMLLNVGPTAEGEIPPEGAELLQGIGKWLETNGEAIFATRPWILYGEGPTRMAKSGGFSENNKLAYTKDDVRYTRSKDGKAVYVLALGWPDTKLALRSLQIDGKSDAASVTLLGYDGTVDYDVNAKGQLVLSMPPQATQQFKNAHAVAFKLSGFETSLHTDARFNLPDAITVAPEKVTLEGAQVRVQQNDGRHNIGAWDRADERCHWLVPITRAGTYALRAELSSANGPSRMRVSFSDQTAVSDVPKTDGWFKQKFVGLGEFTFAKPGVYHLTLSPAEAKSWKAVNVWQLQLAPTN